MWVSEQEIRSGIGAQSAASFKELLSKMREARRSRGGE